MSPRQRGSGRVGGVHVIVGSESFLAEEALQGLLSASVGADRSDSVQVLRGDETTWARVIDAARMRSLFADRRAVVVRGADALKGDGEEVEAYLDDPTPEVTLIILAGRPDRRRTVWKRLLDRSAVVSAGPLRGRVLTSYVAERLRRRKLVLTEEGLSELLERAGQDLRRLMGEIDKLEAFGQGKAPLSAEDVAAVLGRGVARPLYRLGDAMAARRAGEVLELIDELVEEGEAPLKVLGTLHRAVRQVRGALALREARASRDEIVARLDVRPAFKVGDLLDATRRWSEADLRAALAALDRADRGIKTGAEARAALAAAVTDACRERSGAVKARREVRSTPPPGR